MIKKITLLIFSILILFLNTNLFASTFSIEFVNQTNNPIKINPAGYNCWDNHYLYNRIIPAKTKLLLDTKSKNDVFSGCLIANRVQGFDLIEVSKKTKNYGHYEIFDNGKKKKGIAYPGGLIIYASDNEENGFMRVASNSASVEIKAIN